MEEKLKYIVGNAVLIAGDMEHTIMLAKLANYYNTQLKMIKKQVESPEIKGWIDEVLNIGKSFLNEVNFKVSESEPD